MTTLSMLIKVQPDATVCRYLFTAKSHYMFQVSQHPSSGVLKTVTTASDTGHNTGAATCLQRGLIGPRWREVAVPILWPIMTNFSEVVYFLVGLRTYQHPGTTPTIFIKKNAYFRRPVWIFCEILYSGLNLNARTSFNARHQHTMSLQ